MRVAFAVLVGIGQLVNKRKEQTGEPIEYMAECAFKAADNLGNRDVLKNIDSLAVVNVISRDYSDAPQQLAERLMANPKDMVTTPIGATAPQALASRLCDRISKGKSEIGLICGAEAFYSKNRSPDLEPAFRWLLK